MFEQRLEGDEGLNAGYLGEQGIKNKEEKTASAVTLRQIHIWNI